MAVWIVVARALHWEGRCTQRAPLGINPLRGAALGKGAALNPLRGAAPENPAQGIHPLGIPMCYDAMRHGGGEIDRDTDTKLKEETQSHISKYPLYFLHIPPPFGKE